jgi:ABC-type multidrug transport system fused ATPase/permease subunit
LINLSTVGVSLYLSFALTQRFTDGVLTSEECKDERDHQYNVALASIIGVALFVSFVGKYISNMIFMKINKRIHHKIVDSVLHSGLIFFEQNTQGRILNRFSKDIQTLDYLVFDFLEMIDYMTKCFFSIVIIIFVIPWLSVVVGLSLIYLVNLRKRCILVTQDPIRLKTTLMSPINSLIQDTVNGLATVRCLKQKNQFLHRLQETTDL